MQLEEDWRSRNLEGPIVGRPRRPWRPAPFVGAAWELEPGSAQRLHTLLEVVRREPQVDILHRTQCRLGIDQVGQRQSFEHYDGDARMVEGREGSPQRAKAQQVRHPVGAANRSELVAHAAGHLVPQTDALETSDQVRGEPRSG